MSLRNFIAGSILLLINTDVIFAEQIISSTAIAGTELVLAFVVHRHGDRTPEEETVSFSDNPDKVRIYTDAYGYGQLTEVGKRRGYDIGQFIRNRYNGLLSSKYNSSEIYIRSTDYTRTQMTVLTAMAAVYRPYPGSWSRNINWVPTPYTTVPEIYDFNTAFSNCPNFLAFMNKMLLVDYSGMAEYTDILNTIADITGFNITETPLMVYSLWNVYTCQKSLGIPLRPELEALYPQIQEAADKAIDILNGNDAYIPLQAGVLLNEFLEVSALVRAGLQTPRVRVYSAHDFNVYSFEAITRITPRQGVPKFGSIFSLELRKIVKTGQFVVLPVYLESPEQKPKYLQVEDCDNLLCNIDQFINITSKYALNFTEWKTECNFIE